MYFSVNDVISRALKNFEKAVRANRSSPSLRRDRIHQELKIRFKNGDYLSQILINKIS